MRFSVLAVTSAVAAPPNIIQDNMISPRIRALRALQILDTSREPVFDAIVVEAAAALRTPIALISLVDGHRQWFKAEIGMGVPQTSLRESICEKAIEHSGIFVVPNTVVDPRVNGNPLVTGEAHVRFYAGAPLVTTDGHALGMLCVLDRKERPNGIDKGEGRILLSLSERVMSEFERRYPLNKTLQLENSSLFVG